MKSNDLIVARLENIQMKLFDDKNRIEVISEYICISIDLFFSFFTFTDNTVSRSNWRVMIHLFFFLKTRMNKKRKDIKTEVDSRWHAE